MSHKIDHARHKEDEGASYSWEKKVLLTNISESQSQMHCFMQIKTVENVIFCIQLGILIHRLEIVYCLRYTLHNDFKGLNRMAEGKYSTPHSKLKPKQPNGIQVTFILFTPVLLLQWHGKKYAVKKPYQISLTSLLASWLFGHTRYLIFIAHYKIYGVPVEVQIATVLTQPT